MQVPVIDSWLTHDLSATCLRKKKLKKVCLKKQASKPSKQACLKLLVDLKAVTTCPWWLQWIGFLQVTSDRLPRLFWFKATITHVLPFAIKEAKTHSTVTYRCPQRPSWKVDVGLSVSSNRKLQLQTPTNHGQVYSSTFKDLVWVGWRTRKMRRRSREGH